MSRRSTRELAMKLLYQYSITGQLDKSLPEGDGDTPDMADADMEYIDGLAAEYPAHKEQIDEIISHHSHAWKIERISKVDLAILRLALFEILFVDSVPPKVSVNEAVELAKKYSGEKSHKYINGLLGGYLRSLEEG